MEHIVVYIKTSNALNTAWSWVHPFCYNTHADRRKTYNTLWSCNVRQKTNYRVWTRRL